MAKYFDEEVDNAIFEFQKSEDRARREVLCRDFILPAFNKLSGYWYNRLPLINNEETIHDCVAYLYEKIDMFEESKGKRGFAYFNMIARHWYFQKLKSEKRESVYNNLEAMAPESSVDSNILLNENLIDREMDSKYDEIEFMNLLKKRLPKWRDKAKKEQERKVLEALIVLFENIENIDIFKKKAVLFYLREYTGMTSKQIALNLNKIKKRFFKFKEDYLRGDI